MAGVPRIFEAMVASVLAGITGGAHTLGSRPGCSSKVAIGLPRLSCTSRDARMPGLVTINTPTNGSRLGYDGVDMDFSATSPSGTAANPSTVARRHASSSPRYWLQ